MAEKPVPSHEIDRMHCLWLGYQAMHKSKVEQEAPGFPGASCLLRFYLSFGPLPLPTLSRPTS